MAGTDPGNRRRLLIALGAGALAAPYASFAQQQGKVRRIGFLGAISASGYASQMEGFRSGLRDFGYVEGKNLVVEYRWAEGKYERLLELAAELIRSKVEVIVTHGTPGTRAAKQATTTIPIVMATVADPVATGIVASFARPGGNITGSTFSSPELNAKRLDLLKEVMPQITQAAIILNPNNPMIATHIKETGIVAKALKVGLQRFEVRGPDEFEATISSVAKARINAVVVSEDPVIIANVARIAVLATKQRLAAAGNREFAEAGGLIGYGVNFPAIFRRAAYFVDRILKGARPGDIPVEQATRFELIVNQKTARTLGIKIPQSILVRADRVIE